MRWKQASFIGCFLAGGVGPAAYAITPDLSGNWQVVEPAVTLRTISGDLPPLLPGARVVYDSHVKQRANGDLTFDTTSRCLPPGVPRIMYEQNPFQIVQRPQFIYMLFEYQHLNREIFFGDTHLPRPGRSFLGDSIARWDGSTLVVDTTNLKDDTLLDGAGLPHSRVLHVIERYQLINGGNELQDRILIDDSKTYARPWETEVWFKRLPDVVWKEDVCADRQPHWFRDMLNANQ